jgi:hypothetical protein
MGNRSAILCLFLVACCSTPSASSLSTVTQGHSSVIPLAGDWRVELDRGDVGVQEAWFARHLVSKIRLPGVLQAQGFGDPISIDTRWTGEIVDRSWFTAPEYAEYRVPGNIKIPFWLQPERHYTGVAWYQRDIEIPAEWKGRRAVLFLERPHWQTSVWLDDRPVGTNDSLSTPHQYDLGLVSASVLGSRRLTIRLDNRLVVDVGVNSHSVSDHTQGNWNGIVGRAEVYSTDPVWIEDLQVYPHMAAKSVTVRGRIGNRSGRAGRGSVTISVQPAEASRATSPPPKTLEVSWEIGGGEFSTEYSLGASARTWDEFSPFLYRASTQLGTSGDARSVTFGLREIGTEGTGFRLNGRPAFIRGTLECAIFPKTGHPPTDVDSWLRIIRIAKAHGLNNIRFHSWCPPEAAFEAADRLGFYYLVECGSWANTSTRLGVGLPIDQWLYREADRILASYGNRPSFLLLAYGNEPAGDFNRYLGEWVRHYRSRDSRRLYTGASGWPQIPENQFHVTPDPRIQAWGAGLKSRINALPPETRTDYRDYIQKRSVPVISHEIGQWCVYPNFEEMPKYTGYLKPRNFEIFRETLTRHGMADQARDFLMASGRLQTLCYKEDIESALRTPGMGGFQLLDLHDFPGQGTALVGILDPFWDPKGYVSAEEYSRFCGSTVPLVRLQRRVFTSDDVLEADLEIAHFGPEPLRGATVNLKLVSAGGTVTASEVWSGKDIPVGNANPLGRWRANLSNAQAPGRFRLVAGIGGTRFENDWDIWVYPPRVDTVPPADLLIARELDDRAVAALRGGGKAFLQLPPGRVRGDANGRVATGFSSIFWNTAWTRRQAPHTLGILCRPEHPALAAFPTEYHSNWQWWYVLSRGQAMILDGMPQGLRPIVQVIDDWFTGRKLGLVFEAKVEGGRLLVSSVDLQGDLGSNPVARQFLHTLLRYTASDRFAPSVDVTAEQIRSLYE